MEINALQASKNYTALRDATRPSTTSGGSVVGQAAMDFAQTLKQTEEISKQAMTSDMDPHVLVQALAQTELAVDTAVTVRNKVVEAYQEILRMPV